MIPRAFRRAVEQVMARAFSSWQQWTPVVEQDGDVSQSLLDARYCLVGKLCVAYGRINVTGNGAADNAIIIKGLPFPMYQAGWLYPLGVFRFYDASESHARIGMAGRHSGTDVLGCMMDSAGWLGAAPSVALANGDNVSFEVTYQIA